MSRQRMLSPKFFTDARICVLPPLTRLLFQGLWGEADREGRLVDSPVDLKIRILPVDHADVDSMLADLDKAGLIQRYEVAGRRLIWVCKFLEHQHPHHLEAKSTLPPPGASPVKQAVQGPSTQGEPRKTGDESTTNPTESVTVTVTESVKKPAGEKPPAPLVLAPVEHKPPKPVAVSELQLLKLALVADYESIRHEKYNYGGVADTEGLKKLLTLATADVIRSRWGKGLRLGAAWPGVATIAQLASSAKWNALAAPAPPSKGPIDAGTQSHTQTGWVTDF